MTLWRQAVKNGHDRSALRRWNCLPGNGSGRGSASAAATCWARIGLALVAAAVFCLVIRAWDPPFAYRIGRVPGRDIVARVAFAQEDPGRHDCRPRQRARERGPLHFHPGSQAAGAVAGVAAQHGGRVDGRRHADEGEQVGCGRSFSRRRSPARRPRRRSEEQRFQAFRAAFAGPEQLGSLRSGAARTPLPPFEQRGLLDLAKLPQRPGKGDQLGHGNQEEICVHPVGQPRPARGRQGGRRPDRRRRGHPPCLEANLQSVEVADRVFAWVRPRLKPTLEPDEAATQEARNKAAADVQPVMVKFEPGQTLVPAKTPLTAEQNRTPQAGIRRLRGPATGGVAGFARPPPCS